MQILSLIQDRFLQALEGWVEDPAQYVEQVAVARDARFGDYQANIAMPLAKTLGAKPREIAEQIVERLQVEDLCEPATIAGPGFINLKLKLNYLGEQVTHIAADSRLSVGQVTPRKYIIDYSSPNVAKPMHVGHIRTTVIGDALVRILRFLGHQVIADNHLGDWGTQFGMIIYGYKHFVDPAAFETQPVAELGRIYRIVQSVIAYQAAVLKLPQAEQKLALARQRRQQLDAEPNADAKQQKKELKAAERSVKAAEEELEGLRQKVEAVQGDSELRSIAQDHENIEQKAQLETAKLHEGHAENLELWKKFMPISITEIESVYDRLGIRFDYTYGESFYQPMLGGVVERLIERGLAEENEGAICVFLPGFDTPMIVRKRDGAFLYATTDLATIEYRMEKFSPDAMLYVVDHRQSEHFEKLFAAARAMGYRDVELKHISFGTVLGADGKPFKTRSGNVLGLDYLLDEAVERAYEVVCDPARLQKAGLELSEEEKRHVANVVGLGAIKYADLSHNRTSDYKFDIAEMVQLEGDTAAYIQYMYARASSILRKAETEVNAANVERFPVMLQEDAERALALQLLQFEDALRQSVSEYYPSVLAAYLYSLARMFAVFFDQCSVLKADSTPLQQSRLVLCYATRQVLSTGLELLGIDVVERM
ncbi:MAG: arginine--tRNA ligase [bacterium]|nr:arginine--tRNA ligase [bacterium]